MNDNFAENLDNEKASVQPDAQRIIEALMIATNEPLPLKKIAEILKIPQSEIVHYIEALNNEYKETNRAFEIKEVAGGYQIYTLPEFAEWVGLLQKRRERLSRAALETLAIIAYHQPITRPEIEKARGVDSSWILESLLQKGLIRTCGRLQVPGRPIKYATTKEFLRYFGIKNLSELPREEDFAEKGIESEAQVKRDGPQETEAENVKDKE